MACQTVGVYSETAPGERRVAVVPGAVHLILELGLEVLVETEAGRRAYFPDSAYICAGARIVSRSELFDAADMLIGVRPPNITSTHRFRAGQALTCLLQPLYMPDVIRRWADQGLTAIAADLVPRTPGRAQLMDALSSQDQVAGYQAILTAADTFGRCLAEPPPGGEIGPPPQILVLGRGPAGREAALTARRLGAIVRVCEACEGSCPDIAARGIDIIVVTAEIPGHRPPVLVPAWSVRAMRPGSVIVDTTASAFGCAVELAEPNAIRVVEPGVTVIGDDNLASKTPTSASAAYATSIAALLAHLVRGGALSIDLTDPIQSEVVVTHDRSVYNHAVWQRILDQISLAGLP